MQISLQQPEFTTCYYSWPINHRLGRKIHIGLSQTLNRADETLELILAPSHVNDLQYSLKVSLSCIWDECDEKKASAVRPFFQYLILQILCRASPMSLWFSPGSPPWLGCPCRGSCTLGTWDHSCTSSHCPCRQIRPLHCRLCSWELPAQSPPSSSQGGSLAIL